MPSKRRRAPALSPKVVRPLVKPIVAPVLERLARSEKLLLDMKQALDIQFKRTAAIQAQLDRLCARLARRN